MQQPVSENMREMNSSLNSLLTPSMNLLFFKDATLPINSMFSPCLLNPLLSLFSLGASSFTV